MWLRAHRTIVFMQPVFSIILYLQKQNESRLRIADSIIQNADETPAETPNKNRRHTAKCRHGRLGSGSPPQLVSQPDSAPAGGSTNTRHSPDSSSDTQDDTHPLVPALATVQVAPSAGAAERTRTNTCTRARLPGGSYHGSHCLRARPFRSARGKLMNSGIL